MKRNHFFLSTTQKHLIIVFLLLLSSSGASAQIWGIWGNRLHLYDIETNLWIERGTPDGNLALNYCTYIKGNVYVTATLSNGALGNYNALYKYDVASRQWTRLAYDDNISNLPYMFRAVFQTKNDNILLLSGYTHIFKHDLTTNVASNMGYGSAMPGVTIGSRSLNSSNSFDGNYYYYVMENTTIDIARYDFETNTWGPKIVTASNAINPNAILALNNALYYFVAGVLYKYDFATNTATQLQNATDGLYPVTSMVSDGVNIYASGKLISNPSSTSNFFKFNFTTKKWEALLSSTMYGSNYDARSLTFDNSCNIPTATLNSVSATCVAKVPTNDAQLILNSHSGATKVGYSIGSSYTGADFASASTIGTAPFTLANNLPNPTINQPYTVRLYSSATCFKDYSVLLNPAQCTSADLSLTVSPPTQSGALGEILTYTVTLSNAGPETTDNVTVKVPMPKSVGTFLSASPQQGTYSESKQIWDVGSMAIGSSTTMTISIKIK